jgi:hypothetical protein
MAGAKNLTRLNVALTLSTGAFGKSMSRATVYVDKFAGDIQRSMLGALAPLTAAFSGAAIVAGIKIASDRIDGLAKSADKLGVSTQSLAGLRLAADESGSSAEALEAAMGKLQVKVAEAAAGNKDAQKTFTDLGVPLKDLVNLRADQQFSKVADAIQQIETKGDQARMTVDLFGKSGLDLTNVLAQGSAGFTQAAIDAERLGLAVSRVDAFKVEEANDAFGRIGKVIEGIFNNLTIQLAPFITAFAQAFTGASIEANGFGSVIDSVVKGAIQVVGFFADAWQGITLGFQAARVGVALVGMGIVSAMESAYRSVEWLAQKFVQAFDLMGAVASVLWNTLKVGWAAMRVPISDFVQFAAGQMSDLLKVASDAAYQFSAAQGTALLEASMSIRASTGAMGAEARKNLDQNVAGLQAASKSVADSTTALFSSVTTEGSMMLTMLKDDFAALADAEMMKMQEMRNQPLASDGVTDAAARIQTEAQVRAEGRALELEATQTHADAKRLIETKSTGDWMRDYEASLSKEQQLRERNARYALSGASSMFSNLSKLQESNSSKAAEVGKAAAKAKIVADTASAAMGAYSSLAGIPIVGPALGIAAAAAAVVAGGIQLGNVDKGGIGSSNTGGPADTSTTNIGGVSGPASPGQTLVLQGDSFSAEGLVKVFQDAKERGYVIEGVRRD